MSSSNSKESATSKYHAQLYSGQKLLQKRHQLLQQQQQQQQQQQPLQQLPHHESL